MGHPIALTLTLAAGSATAIALAQARGSAGNLTLNGAAVSAGVATLSPARRVAIASVGDDSGITWTVTGTDRFGNAQVETITGATAGNSVATTQDFLTVTRIASSGAAAGNVTAGTNNTASTQWVPWDTYAFDYQISCYGVVQAGSPTWQVDKTYDDVFGTWLPSGVPFPRSITDLTLNGLTATADGYIPAPCRATRLTLVAAGTVQLEQIQQGY